MSRFFGKTLYVILGLTAPSAGKVHKLFQTGAECENYEAIIVPGPKDDNKVYTRKNASQALQKVCEHVVQGRTRSVNKYDPSKIVLLYVPGGMCERALSNFDFFVYPYPLDVLAQFSSGSMLRHVPDVAEREVRDAVDNIRHGKGGIKEFIDQIHHQVRRPSALLPPKNFVRESETLTTTLKNIRNGTQSLGCLEDVCLETKVSKKDLPSVVRRREKRFVYVDSREAVFVPARVSEYHGDLDEPESAGENWENWIRVLNGLYRFGIPINAGMHFDVQRYGKKPLNLCFDCSVKGCVRVDSHYANIYPNDFVRC